MVGEQFGRTVVGGSDRAAIMVQGKIRAVGEPAAIEAELSSAYLGGQ